MGVMLRGNDTSDTFGVGVTLAALTMGGVLLRLAAALSSCCVVVLRGRYPARSAPTTSAPAISTAAIRRFRELPLPTNILGNPYSFPPGAPVISPASLAISASRFTGGFLRSQLYMM